MADRIYAMIGHTFQQIGGECPEGHTEMLCERPTPTSIATHDGTWYELPTTSDSGNTSAREYRNAELARADIMLNRVQDGEKGIGTQKAWREYRVELRNWPDTEDFPATPPVAPI